MCLGSQEHVLFHASMLSHMGRLVQRAEFPQPILNQVATICTAMIHQWNAINVSLHDDDSLCGCRWKMELNLGLILCGHHTGRSWFQILHYQRQCSVTCLAAMIQTTDGQDLCHLPCQMLIICIHSVISCTHTRQHKHWYTITINDAKQITNNPKHCCLCTRTRFVGRLMVIK